MDHKKKKIPSDVHAFMRELVQESLRNWFKKEDWVRIASDGSIAGPCGTSKNKKNPDRCLPRAKANSMTKAERAATARKKKKAGAKGQTVVPNTKKGKVTKGYTKESILSALNLLKEEKEIDYTKLLEKIIDKLEGLDLSIDYLSSAITKKSALGVGIDQGVLGRLANPKRITKEDVRNLVVGLVNEDQEEVLMEKDDRCTRIAKRKYDTWPSAYASGAVVRCRRGEIWKNEK